MIVPRTDTIASKRAQEKATVETMVTMYCRAKHDGATPCADCRALIDYCHARVDSCPHMENKTFCSACKTHCYTAEMRRRIREAMRWAGPRMLFKHPVMAIRHALSTRN